MQRTVVGDIVVSTTRAEVINRAKKKGTLEEKGNL